MFDSVTIHALIQNIYKPKNVDNVSEMVGSIYQYLVALNNKGSSSHEVRLSERVSMNTLDKAIKYKDLYFLEIEVFDNSHISYSFWKYPKKTDGEVLHTQKYPFKQEHMKYVEKLGKLSKELNLPIKLDE